MKIAIDVTQIGFGVDAGALDAGEDLPTGDSQPQPTVSWRPLAERLPERTAPDLVYLEATFAALMSYGLTVGLLIDILPLDQEINVATVFRHVQQVAERLAQVFGEEHPMIIEGCHRKWEQLPEATGPLMAAMFTRGKPQAGNKAGSR
jgi:hypothetical protein